MGSADALRGRCATRDCCKPRMADPLFWHRLQFAFTIIYHYLFPQLTMGLGWFLVYWKWRALRTGDEKYIQAARFWAKIFGLNFAVGVETGIPMEFQFGTNWAGFSKYAGGVIGQTLAMEDHRRGGHFSRRSSLDARPRKLAHRLRRRGRPQVAG